MFKVMLDEIEVNSRKKDNNYEQDELFDGGLVRFPCAVSPGASPASLRMDRTGAFRCFDFTAGLLFAHLNIPNGCSSGPHVGSRGPAVWPRALLHPTRR